MSEPSTQGPPSPSEASLPAAASAKSNLRESATLKDQSIDKAAAQVISQKTEGLVEIECACGDEALRLLNCVAAAKYEQPRCVTLLMALRRCCEEKSVRSFSLACEEEPKK